MNKFYMWNDDLFFTESSENLKETTAETEYDVVNEFYAENLHTVIYNVIRKEFVDSLKQLNDIDDNQYFESYAKLDELVMNHPARRTFRVTPHNSWTIDRIR